VRFKQYNDTYGHGHGDAVLARIGHVLKTFCQRAGDCAARYGGEEFTLLLPGVACGEAVRIAQRLRASVAGLSISNAVSQTSAKVSVSIGVASLSGSAVCQRAQLVEAADVALYRAKRGGRNRVEYQALS
jgi:diguanylate cyclase (GGDEF)-like protein